MGANKGSPSCLSLADTEHVFQASGEGAWFVNYQPMVSRSNVIIKKSVFRCHQADIVNNALS